VYGTYQKTLYGVGSFAVNSPVVWNSSPAHGTYHWMLLENILRFLLHISTLTRDIDIANMSVRLSICLTVCPSVMFWY